MNWTGFWPWGNLGVSVLGILVFLTPAVIDWCNAGSQQTASDDSQLGRKSMLISLFGGVGCWWVTLALIYAILIRSELWFNRLAVPISDVGNLAMLSGAMISRAHSWNRQHSPSPAPLERLRVYVVLLVWLLVFSLARRYVTSEIESGSASALQLLWLQVLAAPSITISVLSLASMAVTIANHIPDSVESPLPSRWLTVFALFAYACLQYPAYVAMVLAPVRPASVDPAGAVVATTPAVAAAPIVAVLAFGKLGVLACMGAFLWTWRKSDVLSRGAKLLSMFAAIASISGSVAKLLGFF